MHKPKISKYPHKSKFQIVGGSFPKLYLTNQKIDLQEKFGGFSLYLYLSRFLSLSLPLSLSLSISTSLAFSLSLSLSLSRFLSLSRSLSLSLHISASLSPSFMWTGLLELFHYSKVRRLVEHPGPRLALRIRLPSFVQIYAGVDPCPQIRGCSSSAVRLLRISRPGH